MPLRGLYEQVAAEAHIDTQRPDGLIIHTASETPDGTVRIVDVWESQQHVDEFGPRACQKLAISGTSSSRAVRAR